MFKPRIATLIKSIAVLIKPLSDPKTLAMTLSTTLATSPITLKALPITLPMIGAAALMTSKKDSNSSLFSTIVFLILSKADLKPSKIGCTKLLIELAKVFNVPPIPSDFSPKASATCCTIGMTFSENNVANSKTIGKSASPIVVFAFSNWAVRMRVLFAKPSLVRSKSPCAADVC